MREMGYLGHDDSSFALAEGDYLAQIFTPAYSFRPWRLGSKLWASGQPFFAEKFITDVVADEPVGSALYSTIGNYHFLPIYSPGRMSYGWGFGRPVLNANTKYALIHYLYPVWGVATLNIRYDQGDADYAYGHMLHSNDGGLTWTHYYNDDISFVITGDPPDPTEIIPPEPEPGQPPLDIPYMNWAILDYSYQLVPGGFQISLVTTMPCHLYMYWTTFNPWVHPQPGLRRGLVTLTDYRMCFTTYHKNEQEEFGDTIYHTFTKLDWPVCQTRWFVFRGTVDGTWSNSESPIFELHMTEETLPSLFYEPWTWLGVPCPPFYNSFLEYWSS